MSLTWQKFIDAEKSFKIYLVKIKPYKKYDSFSVHSGATHKKNVNEKIIACRFDLTGLTLGTDENSLSAGEFFYKESTKELFIRCPGDVTPSIGSVYGYFYIYFCNRYDKNIGDPDGVYWRESIDEMPTVTRGRSGTLTRLTVSFGELSIRNGDNFFNDIWMEYFWNDIECEILITGFVYGSKPEQKTWLPWANAKTIFKGCLRRKSFTDNLVKFEICDLIDLLDIPFPLSTYDSTTYTNLDPNAEGQPIQRGYGILKGIKAVQIDTTGNGSYKIDDQTINSFDSIYDEDGATLSTSSTDTTKGEFTLSAATSKAVFVNYTKNTGAGSPYNRAGSIKKEILENVLGIAAANIDLNSYTTLDTDRPYTLGISIKEQTPIVEVFDFINRSVLAEDITSRDGKLKTRKITKPAAGDPDQQVYDEEQNLIGEEGPEIEISNVNVASSVLIGYEQNHSLPEELQFKYEAGTGAGTDFETIKIITINTALVNSADAATVTGIYKTFIEKPEIFIKFKTPIKPFSQFVGETFKFSRRTGKGPDSLTAYWKILKINENFNTNQTEILGVQ